MSVRQYVGARYVPKFFEYNNSSEWVSGVPYEALTIVTRSGNSYTSKKPVPANIGAPESNPEYWVSTGIYNSQIEAYREEVGELGEDVAELSETVEHVRTVSRKRFVLIGDSYNTNLHYSWGEKFMDLLGLTSGVNAWNLGLPGAGFGTAEGNNFLSALQTVKGSMTADQALDITDVIIQGGINDWASSSTDIQNGVRACEQYIMQNFPHANLWIICAGWGYSYDDMRSEVLNAYNYYQNASVFGSVMHRAYTMFLTPYALDSDMVHPTETSADRLSKMIVNFVHGGNTFFWHYTGLKSIFGGLTITGNITPYGVHVKNTDTTYIEVADSVTVERTTPVTIATHSGITNQNFFMRKAEIPARALLRTTGNDYYDIDCVLTVEKQANAQAWDLKISNRTLVDGSFTIENVKAIYPVFDAWLDIDKT